MNETVIIRIKKDGSPLRLGCITDGGVACNSEGDACPRGLMLEFNADSPITRLRMDQVRQGKGWGSKAYKLNLSLCDETLVITGVDPAALPAGRYWFRLQLGDFILPSERIRLDLKENQKTPVEIEVKTDPRQVEILRHWSMMDLQIQRVLARSEFDGRPLTGWLCEPNQRPSRKACLLNLLAKLRTAPDAREPLLTHVDQILSVDAERCCASVDGELIARLRALTAEADRPFAADHLPSTFVHRRLLRHIKNLEGDAERFRIHSFRQKGCNGLLALVAVPHDDHPSRRHYAEFGIEHDAAGCDNEGFVVHMGELLSLGKTDHLQLRDHLAEDPMVRNFLYYRVIHSVLDDAPVPQAVASDISETSR